MTAPHVPSLRDLCQSMHFARWVIISSSCILSMNRDLQALVCWWAKSLWCGLIFLNFLPLSCVSNHDLCSLMHPLCCLYSPFVYSCPFATSPPQPLSTSCMRIWCEKWISLLTPLRMALIVSAEFSSACMHPRSDYILCIWSNTLWKSICWFCFMWVKISVLHSFHSIIGSMGISTMHSHMLCHMSAVYAGPLSVVKSMILCNTCTCIGIPYYMAQPLFIIYNSIYQ